MRKREILARARLDGWDAGRASASWVFYGNTPENTYRTVLRGIHDGDPAVLDQFNPPDLSGQWADSPTPQSLAEDYGITAKRDPDGVLLDEVCAEWEDRASAAFWEEIERTCQYYVKTGEG